MISLQVNLDMSVALARMVTPEDLQAMTRHAGDDLRDLLKNHLSTDPSRPDRGTTGPGRRKPRKATWRAARPA